jgi:putative membrane protein
MLNPASPTFDANLAALAGKLQTDIGTAALPAGIDPAHLAGGALVQANAGLTAIIAGLDKITIGLNGHTPGTFGQATDPSAPNYDPGGIDFGLLSLLDPAAGLPAAVAGLDKLATGSGSALTGSQKLTAGSGDALTGSQKLASGLGQLSAGQHQVATGLPAAVDGSGQIADGIDQVLAGAQKVDGGIRAVQSGAVGPLTTQLAQGSQNAKKQVAVVEAAGSLAAQAPGGAGTSYVLSQFNPKLAAATTTTASKDSHTARNVGLGLGGLVALVIAVTAGFALGRRSQVSTIA